MSDGLIWVLIVINLSGWDGSLQDSHPIGAFSSKTECQEEMFRLNKTIDGHSNPPIFSCVEHKP